jgi:gamma-glutamylcyclotransferase (GGCT)/AIG2-like uncharacterized protein YtfP
MRAEEPHYLFVYGTLRTGFNHPVNREIMNDVEWMGESAIRGKLYDIGKYPGALRATDSKQVFIKGEVLRIKYPKKVLRILDQYEGFDPELPGKSEYYRDQELVRLADGKEIKAWVYWYNFPVEGKRRIRHRDYLDYLKKKKSS